MRHPMAACLVAGLLGGALVLLGAGRPWGPATPVPTVSADAVNPIGTLVSSLGAVVLLGTVVVTVTRSHGRRLAGAVVVLAALATGYVTLTADGAWSGWRLAVLAGALLGVLAGTLAALLGPRWAAMGERYDAP
ncbi:MAG: hypothetical protein M3165_09935, partial [Actinomycetota bacterium]|nr:hypothetical protein [Actinomycetota bacterium]